MQNDFELIRSDRKTIAIQIMQDLHIRVRAPRQMPMRNIRALLVQKEQWIARARRRMQALSVSNASEKLSADDLDTLKQQAKMDFTARTEHYAKKIDVNFEKISVRCQSTRWGSCSNKGNLSFNCLLMFAPEYVRNYIVVHELCHRLHMNHSPSFWATVSKTLPDYPQAKLWLKENGHILIAKIK